MSPGMTRSSRMGGFGFGHAAPRFTPTPRNRIYQPPHGRFSVTPNNSGGSNITLTPDETVGVGTDADGNVTIAVNPKPAENGNDTDNGLGRAARRGLYGAVDRLMVSSNSDGSITIHPTGPDNVLQVTGDEAMGQVVVTEIEPVDHVPAA
jgi:hypothetical protein